MAGPIYSLEEEIRGLCEDPAKNCDELYKKLIDLIWKLIRRNPTKVGPDVDRESLPHEIVSDIIPRLINGTLRVEKWSAYIMKVLPRFVNNNIKYNTTEIIDTISRGVDPKAVLDMSHAGSICIIQDRTKSSALLDLYNLPNMIGKWMDSNIKYLDNPKDHHNLRLSVLLSFILDQVTLFRLPNYYETQVIFYLNKLKLYMAKILASDPDRSAYDQIIEIANYESMLENCDD